MRPVLEPQIVTPRGEMWVNIASPEVLVSRASGHLDLTMMNHLLVHLESWRCLPGGPKSAFHDWQSLRDYDSEARLVVTAWLRQHRSQFRAVHILVDSQAIAWGIRIVNGLTGALLVPYHQRVQFEDVRRKALAG